MQKERLGKPKRSKEKQKKRLEKPKRGKEKQNDNMSYVNKKEEPKIGPMPNLITDSLLVGRLG